MSLATRGIGPGQRLASAGMGGLATLPTGGWGDAWDDIDLQVLWDASLLVNGGGGQSFGTTLDIRLAASSTAGPAAHYRLRESGGGWSPWAAYVTQTTFVVDGPGEYVLEAQFRDSDGNTSPIVMAGTTVFADEQAAEIITVEPVQKIIAGVLGYLGDELVAEFRVVGGSVTADVRNAVVRTCTIEFAPGIWSGGRLLPGKTTHRDVYELLATPGLELAVRRGWRTPYGEEVVISLGRFVVEEATYTEGEAGTEVACDGSDLAVRIQRARWADPYQIASGTQLAAALDELLRDRWPNVKIGFDEVSVPDVLGAAAVLEAGPESDPWEDACSLAKAHGYVLYPDVEGVFRLRTPPDPVNAAPVWTFRRGADCVLVEQTRVSPMERVYNGVIATGEGSELDVPVRGEAWDEQPGSPTSIHGPYGYVPRFYSSPLITTEDQARSAALSLLATILGRLEEISWAQIPNPSLAPLDTVAIADEDGTLRTYIIDELTIPLSPTEAMTATARETRVAYASESAAAEDEGEELD